MGRLVNLSRYEDEQIAEAEGIRLDLERRLNRSATPHEVVILQADSEETLRQTHRRYFEDIQSLTSA